MASWQRILYVVFIAQLFTSMGFSIVFPFLPLYIKSLHSTSHFSAEVLSGLVFSSQAIAMAIASPFWGAIADRYGRKPMMMRAMIGGGITILLMGFVTTAEQLIFLRAIQGLLSGVVSASMALVASVTPREKSGFSMGFMQLSMWVGVSIGPFTGGILADNFGFRLPFIVTSILLILAAIMVWFLVDENFVAPVKTKKQSFHLIRNWGRILSTPILFITLTFRFLVSFSTNLLLPILPLFIHQLASHTTKVSTYTGLVVGGASIAGTVSAVYLGRLGDKIGHLKIILLSTFTSALFFIPQGWVVATWQLLLLQILTGASSGGLTPSLSALLATNSRVADIGSVYGLDNSIISAGRALAPIVAASIAMSLGFRSVFVFTGSLFILMAIMAFFLIKVPKLSNLYKIDSPEPPFEMPIQSDKD